MRIAVLVGQYHEGSTAEYVVKAFSHLGHTVAIVTPDVAHLLNSKEFELFFAVDSGIPLQFDVLPLDPQRTAFWCIDYRHNKARSERIPNDLATVQWLSDRGGWVFQAQRDDVDDCHARGIMRVSWLPLAADPTVWRPHPLPRHYALGFVGNVWDRGRARVIEHLIQHAPFKIAIGQPGKVWKERGAALLCQCHIGFNVNSFFGTPVAFDINMRMFETLSCGIPLVTNFVPHLDEVFPPRAAFIRTFVTTEEIIPLVCSLLKDSEFLASGEQGRNFILHHASYEHRLEHALRVLQETLAL